MADHESQEAPGRRAPDKKKVAARVRDFRQVDEAPAAEGVLPLNGGFFQLERMRARQAKTKARST